MYKDEVTNCTLLNLCPLLPLPLNLRVNDEHPLGAHGYNFERYL